MAKPIKVYYVSPNNMGDLLNELIIPQITSRPIKQCLNPVGFDVMGIGSCGGSVWANCFDNPSLYRRVKDTAKIWGGKLNKKPCAIWGTGFIKDFSHQKLRLVRNNISFIAVRGKLSQCIIENALGKNINPVLCDGGILASELLSSLVDKRYRIGFIPHFKEHQVAHDIGLIDMIGQMDDATVIDLREEPIGVIKKIAECECIVSSSLHGCIVADSLHIPNIRVCISDIPGTGFKFDDYYSGYGIESSAVIIRSPSDFPTSKHVIDSYRIRIEDVEKKKVDMIRCLNEFIEKNQL